MEIDEKDKRILQILLENARLTTAQISKQADIPITTVHNRIKSMKESGIIKKFTVEPDYKKLDRPILAFILAKVAYRYRGELVVDQEELARKIKSFPEVQAVSILAGPEDLLIKVRLKDVEALNDFILKKLRELPGIEGSHTIVALKEI